MFWLIIIAIIIIVAYKLGTTFQLQWVFPDDMNQDEMVVAMLDDMEKKMKQIMRI